MLIISRSLAQRNTPPLFHSNSHRIGKGLALALIVVMLATVSLGRAATVSAAPGDLDASFGGGTEGPAAGKVETLIAPRSLDIAHAMVVQPDGKFVLGGSAGPLNGEGTFALARYNANGSRDTTFGNGGMVKTSPDVGTASIKALAIDSSGRIVAAGYVGAFQQRKFVVARYNTNGTIDATFGNGGKVVASVAANDAEAHAVGIQSNGKIVVAGYRTSGAQYQFAALRFNTNGTLDSTFGSSGIFALSFGAQSAQVNALQIQSDDKIILGGYSSNGFALVRLIATSGALDSSFGTSGRVVRDIDGCGDKVNAMTIQPGGKILAIGSCSSTAGNFLMARFNANGTLEGTFGFGGVQSLDFAGNQDTPQAVALQPDGKIVLGGWLSDPFVSQVALARFSADGVLDATFGSSGKKVLPFTNGGNAALAVLFSAGRIIIGGIMEASVTPLDNDFILAGLKPDGSFDTAFASGGKQQFDFTNSADSGSAVVVQGDGKLVVATHSDALGNHLAVTRYDSAGKLDPGFSGDGKAWINFNANTYGNALVLQPDGKIVVAGSIVNNNSPAQAALVRFNTDGAIDPGFGSGGIAVLNLAGGSSANAVAIQADGKLVIAGGSVIANNKQFLAARFSAAGALDNGYGSNGVALTPVGDGEAKALLLQADGKLVLGGDSSTPASAFTLIRLSTTGALDTTYGSGGKATTTFTGTKNTIKSLTLAAGDKVVALGNITLPNAHDGVGLVRYNTNGSIDTTFGTAGKIQTDFGADFSMSGARQLPDGRIVVVGAISAPTKVSDFLVALYNSDGSLSNGFGGGDGLMTTGFRQSADSARGVALQGDGKIVVVGEDTSAFGVTAIALARYEKPAAGPATSTATNTGTATKTATKTSTVAATATKTATKAPTSTATKSPTGTATKTATKTITGTTTKTATGTATKTATGTATKTATKTVTVAPAKTKTNAPTAAAVGFSDVHEADYFYQAVTALASRGIISGYDDGTFRPFNSVTRGQTAKIVTGAFNWAIDTSGGPHFSDVPADSTYFSYVETTYKHGAISGYADGAFRPNNDVTRSQIAKIIVVAAGWQVLDPPTASFNDVPISTPFFSYVETIVARQIMSGYAGSMFKPTTNATRGQIAKIVYGAIAP